MTLKVVMIYYIQWQQLTASWWRFSFLLFFCFLQKRLWCQNVFTSLHSVHFTLIDCNWHSGILYCGCLSHVYSLHFEFSRWKHVLDGAILCYSSTQLKMVDCPVVLFLSTISVTMNWWVAIKQRNKKAQSLTEPAIFRLTLNPVQFNPSSHLPSLCR